MFELGHVRHSERREVDFLCEVVARDWNAPFSHRATDLSPTGAWLRTSFPLEVDDVVVVNLRPPGWRAGRDLTVFARVARSVRVHERNGRRENGMGVRFLDITASERAELTRCLRRAAAGPKIHWRSLAQRLVGYA
jgi:c-di-GMP-binding flagellar brake protein YcgR